MKESLEKKNDILPEIMSLVHEYDPNETFITISTVNWWRHTFAEAKGIVPDEVMVRVVREVLSEENLDSVDHLICARLGRYADVSRMIKNQHAESRLTDEEVNQFQKDLAYVSPDQIISSIQQKVKTRQSS